MTAIIAAILVFLLGVAFVWRYVMRLQKCFLALGDLLIYLGHTMDDKKIDEAELKIIWPKLKEFGLTMKGLFNNEENTTPPSDPSV